LYQSRRYNETVIFTKYKYLVKCFLLFNIFLSQYVNEL